MSARTSVIAALHISRSPGQGLRRESLPVLSPTGPGPEPERPQDPARIAGLDS